MPARSRAACARRLGAGRMGSHGPRDGNSPGHEWGRCSIHKCRVLLQPRRRWRRLCRESPARWSCSSLCQQIPLNSLLTLVRAPLTKSSESPARIAARDAVVLWQSRQRCSRQRLLAEVSAASPSSAPYDFVLLKWAELMKAEWIFLSSHNPPPQPGSFWTPEFDCTVMTNVVILGGTSDAPSSDNPGPNSYLINYWRQLKGLNRGELQRGELQ